MDGNHGIDGKLQSKCGTRCDDEVDRISQLHDDIIVDILSFLSLEQAATTSVLSTRWHDMWRHTATLKFNGKSSDTNCEFIEWVNSVVESHKAHSLKEFTLQCFLEKSTNCEITKWLEFAFSKRVEELTLSFEDKYDDGNGVVLNKLLRSSRPRPSNLFQSSNLKSLSLTSLKVSGGAIKWILRGCRSLERLMMEFLVLTSDVEVCDGATGLMLKHLKINCCRGGKSIKVSAPNLVSLVYYNLNERLLVENVPKLVDVAFVNCRIIKFYCISQLQMLTIGPTYGSKKMLAEEIPTLPKLKELTIKNLGRSEHLLPTTTYLLMACPLLQTFNIEFWKRKYVFEEDMEIEAFVHHHLREFRLSVYAADDHVELVTYILDNCVALRKIVITILKVGRRLPDVETVRVKQDAENAKQLLQPKLPSHVHLQILTEN